MEDGFLRSVGLGSDFNHPYSLAVDPDGIYFDPKRPSHLEAILRTIRRRKDLPRLLKRAEVIRDTIISHHLTKYNVNGSKENLSFLEKIPLDKTVILVTGQVDDDASVLRGGGTIRSNRELLEKARQENPEAFIVYKPHPDVESGNRIGKIPEKVLQRNCDLVASGCSLEDLWPYISELHTLTSLSAAGKSDNEKRSRLLMLSDRQTVSEPLMSIMPRSVAKRTALSICVMLSGLMQTSRVTGCLAE